jgi:hypothetical protein
MLIVGGVLTIADDLLQNQGKQFIDMMEKIADMRFKKEEEAKKDVQEAGGPYDEDFDDDQEDYYAEDDQEDSEEDEVYTLPLTELICRIRKLLKEGEWKKAVACFISLLLECLNNVS